MALFNEGPAGQFQGNSERPAEIFGHGGLSCPGSDMLTCPFADTCGQSNLAHLDPCVYLRKQ
jgi:hypothetical protein